MNESSMRTDNVKNIQIIDTGHGGDSHTLLRLHVFCPVCVVGGRRSEGEMLEGGCEYCILKTVMR